MKKTVRIGGQSVDMVSNAAAPLKYKRIFGEDMLAVILGSPTEAEASNVFMRLGYIYAKTAEGEPVSALSEEGYEEWLEGFEMADYFDAIPKISELYMSSSKGTVDPK